MFFKAGNFGTFKTEFGSLLGVFEDATDAILKHDSDEISSSNSSSIGSQRQLATS